MTDYRAAARCSGRPRLMLPTYYFWAAYYWVLDRLGLYRYDR